MFFVQNETMPGTELSSVFQVIGKTADAKVGFRPLGGNSFRVRVTLTANEPIPALSSAEGWKQPDGGARTTRHSKVVSGQVNLVEAIAEAITAVAEYSDKYAEVNAAKAELAAAEKAVLAAKAKVASLTALKAAA